MPDAITITPTIDNSSLSISADGLEKLKFHEGVQSTYYDDPAGHCTYGVGTLVHRGACTAEESQKTVTDEMIESSLESAIAWTQKTIKRKVTRTQLTQQQFDALASFVYNRGPQYSAKVLQLADEGDFAGVSAYMNRVVYGTVVEKKTGMRAKRILPGLVVRRTYESRPFKVESK